MLLQCVHKGLIYFLLAFLGLFWPIDEGRDHSMRVDANARINRQIREKQNISMVTLNLLLFFKSRCRVLLHERSDPISVHYLPIPFRRRRKRRKGSRWRHWYVCWQGNWTQKSQRPGRYASKVFIIQWLDTGQTLRWTITILVHVGEVRTKWEAIRVQTGTPADKQLIDTCERWGGRRLDLRLTTRLTLRLAQHSNTTRE